MPRSFDLFDTLISGRFLKSAAGNQSTQFPISENVRLVQPDDLIVSDYEYEDRAVKLVREMLGLGNQVIVTPDGKWTGKVWSMLPFKPEEHRGDNLQADVISPSKNGIKAIQTSQHKLTESEQSIFDSGFPNLAQLCREARLRTYDDRYRANQILQVDYNFPVLFLASVVLNRRFPDQTLLMSGRDCFQWQKLMRRLFGRGEYFYTSVIARSTAGDSYHRYIRSFDNPILIDLCGSGTSFSKLYEYKSWLLYKPQSGVKAIEAFITSRACMRLEQANNAPGAKCIGVDEGLAPIFRNQFKVDYENHPLIRVQLDAFDMCLHCIDYYDFSQELNASDDQIKRLIAPLMHRYVDFSEAVEPLRLLAIQDDR